MHCTVYIDGEEHRLIVHIMTQFAYIIVVVCLMSSHAIGQCGVTWREGPSSPITPRYGAAAIWDGLRSATVIGGTTDGTSALGDRWSYYSGNATVPGAWVSEGFSPPAGPRFFHALTRTGSGTYFMFGGSDGTSLLGDLQATSFFAWIVVNRPGPSPRRGHGMVSTIGRLLLFGGTTALPSTTSGETWLYDTNSGGWTLQSLPGPSPRTLAVLVNNPARNEVLLFGGSTDETGDPGSLLGDTWVWSGVWRRMPDSLDGPSPRYMAAAAYDVRRRTIIMFGGYNGGPLNDTWEWNGTAWTELHPDATPPAQFGHSMAWDGENIVMFGGKNGGATSATYELVAPALPLLLGVQEPVSVCPRDSVGLTVDALGGTPPFSLQWQIETGPGEWTPLSSQTSVACPSGQTGMVQAYPLGQPNIELSFHGCGGVSHWNIRCAASNVCGSTATEPTSVTLCPADYNCSGGITISDLFQMLAGFFNGDAAADINGSGVVSVQDIYDFLAAYFSSCE